MNKLDVSINKELKEREKRTNTILSSKQYKFLRRKGKTKKSVEAFENRLRKEIQKKSKSPTFITQLWIKYRVEGLKANQIDYDMVNIFR